MTNEQNDRYEILRLIAVAAAKGHDLRSTAQTALEQAAKYASLEAASMILWDDNEKTILSVAHSENEEMSDHLQQMEKQLFSGLRKQSRLTAAYLSFGGDPPIHSFTIPLQRGQKILGAVIGLQRGERTLVAEDQFLEGLSSLLALAVLADSGQLSGKESAEARAKIRLDAIVELAVTVNHEINNPLTAILGNVQLMVHKHKDLDKELKAKLETIEISALKIRDITQRLLRITNPRSVEYTEGTSMLDLSDEDEDSTT